MTNAKNDFTQGSILKKLALFMLPILGALVLQAAYGAVDLLVVGRFGSTSGLSAVSTGSQVLNLVTFVVIQFATAITILIARYLGEKRPERIGSVIGGGVIVFAAISIVLFLLMVVFAHPIAVLMQAPAEAVDLTTSYVRICGSGIFFIVAYNLMAAIFRGLGDSKSPLLFVLVACIVNIGGDLILVAGLHLDAAGAALATVFAQAVSVVCAVILLIKKKQPFSTNMVPFDSLFIDDLCVDQNIRGKHVGQKLFEHVKEEAKKMGCYEVTLNVWEGNDTARRFYEKMGMVPKETQMEFILK